MVFNVRRFREIRSNSLFVLYQLPILVCDTIETGLCDQILVRVNLTESQPSLPPTSTRPPPSSSHNHSQPSFAYQYAALTVQQAAQTAAPADPAHDSAADYYLDEAYTANERFYTELRLNSPQPPPANLEFELASCAYTSLNLTYTTNRTLTTPSPATIRSLFLLNKHNGVLSSRRTVNEMQPGAYTFTIRLRATHFYSSHVLDSTQFRLIVLPDNSLLSGTSRQLYNYFRFSRDLYKFETNDTQLYGRIELVEKVQPEILAMQSRYLTASDLGSFRREYTLIESRTLRASHVLDNIEMDVNSGELRLRPNGTVEALWAAAQLSGKNELVVYALARVWIGDTAVEYVCEIVVDLRGFKRQKDVEMMPGVAFGRKRTHLRLYEDLAVNSSVYRFVGEQEGALGSVEYALFGSGGERGFSVEAGSGLLRLTEPLSAGTAEFGVKACGVGSEGVCGEVWCVVEVVDLNDHAPVFEKAEYEAGIREDSLPGTVVVTVAARDEDEAASRRLEYFVLDGDAANQVNKENSSSQNSAT